MSSASALQESRLVIWVIAQQLTYWGGFVFGALFLATLLEFIGLTVRSNRDAARYDSYAREILKLVRLALPVSILLGTLMLGGLVLYYPGLFAYLAQLFRPILVVVSIVLFLFPIAVWIYERTWTKLAETGHRWNHAAMGIGANVLGTILLMLVNSWPSFMLSPAGVDHTGRFLGNYWHLLHTATWNASTLHRFLGNIALAAAVIAGYSAYRSMTARDPEQKAYYDRFSFTSLVILFFALVPIPFQGYWLSREIYAYRQQMGITMFGGLLAWVGIILVSIVAFLFLALNYYLWQRITAMVEGLRYRRYSKYLFTVLGICAAVYVTPHTMMMTPLELKQIGGQQHQVLGNYGVESAKQPAINIMVLLTAWSLLIWSRCSSSQGAESSREMKLVTGAFLGAAANILWLGIYGYYVPANVRVGLSLPMWTTTFMMVLLVSLLAIRGRRDRGSESASWGEVANRTHYTVLFLAFVITWVMGLGGYRRSSLRLFWHVNEIVRDNSPWAYTHTVGFVTNVVSLNALIFWGVLLMLLWVRHLLRTLNKAPTLSWSHK
ncbi:MAG: hypothetical protein OEY77_10335 [Nitrospira sp.]|nr:hypothetical protein [Nitrospira sp.]